MKYENYIHIYFACLIYGTFAMAQLSVRESFEYTRGTFLDSAGNAGDGWAGSCL